MNDSLDDLLTSSMTIANGATATSGSSYTITIDPSYLNSSTYTVGVGGGSLDTIDIEKMLRWSMTAEPFENAFPEWEDFQKMCEEYPGLQSAYEHLKVFYKLSIDDWKAKKKGNENV